MTERKFKKKLTRVSRTAMRMPASTGALTPEPSPGGGALPQVLRSPAPGTDIVAWAGERREEIRKLVEVHGGVLLRGFDVANLDVFQELVREIGGDLLDYTYRSTPRTEVEGKVYTSTEYPPDQSIPQHNENSYSRSWPREIFFLCEAPAAEGGRTPIS